MIKNILLNFQKPELLRVLFISIVVSSVTSILTYNLAVRKIPQFATVDLLTLNNDFIMSLSQHRLEKGVSEDDVAKMVKDYASQIQPLLDEISASGNVILFQKQAIVTKSKDITPQIIEVLFNDYLPKKGESNEE